MIKKFLFLEWKSFSRATSFHANLAMTIILSVVGFIYSILFLMLGVGAFYGLKEMKLDPLIVVNKYLIFYFIFDLIVRLMLQKIPVLNIKPLLNMNIRKQTIVNFCIGKTAVSFFNWLHALFFLPFAVVMLIEGYDVVSVILWHLSMITLVYINNFLNIILNNKDNLFAIFLIIFVALGVCQYYQIFNITDYSAPFFNNLYASKWLFLFPFLFLVGLYFYCFNYFKNNLHLDSGLASKHEIAKTENLTWLNQFGSLGTFLKNDIKLIKRNKRSKTTVLMSVLFLFYGLLFFSGKVEAYNNPVMHLFAGIFVTGGFLFTFGQFVPSWDSAYYPLMMTQNIPYREYLNSKWWLIVIATLLSTLLGTFYLYFGLQIYLCILAGAIYNIGINSHLVLLAGAFTKTPIDLSSSKGAFGDKKAFNIQTLLITIPKLLVPLILYGLGIFIFNANTGLLFVAIAGVLGFLFRNKVFDIIEKIYKREKYKTIAAYKQ